jgi:DNA-binding CsgD family transcriptional regulator/PAS domain-containing protein
VKHSDRFRHLSEAIGLIYDAALDDTKWIAYMKRVAELMEASHATFQLLDTRDARNDVALTIGFDPVIEADWRTRKREEDFWLVGAQRHSGRIIVGTEAISVRDMRRQPLYHEICRPLDVEHMIGIAVPLGSHEVVGWSFLRPPSLENFGVVEKRMMGVLLPHLQRAAAMRRAFAALSQRTAAFETALHRSQTATFLIDAHERVQFLNERALQLLRKGYGISITGGRLRCRDAGAQASLRRTLRSCASNVLDSISLVIHTKSGDGVLHASVFPLGRESARFAIDARIVCAVMIQEFRQDAPVHRESVARAFGLTPAEAAVAAHIVEGRTPAQTAELQGVSINTVRTQLKSIFQKCRVRSQSQLVRALLRANM